MVQLAINILEIIGILLIGLVSIDTYGSKKKNKTPSRFRVIGYNWNVIFNRFGFISNQ